MAEDQRYTDAVKEIERLKRDLKESSDYAKEFQRQREELLRELDNWKGRYKTAEQAHRTLEGELPKRVEAAAKPAAWYARYCSECWPREHEIQLHERIRALQAERDALKAEVLEQSREIVRLETISDAMQTEAERDFQEAQHRAEKAEARVAELERERRFAVFDERTIREDG